MEIFLHPPLYLCFSKRMKGTENTPEHGIFTSLLTKISNFHIYQLSKSFNTLGGKIQLRNRIFFPSIPFSFNLFSFSFTFSSLSLSLSLCFLWHFFLGLQGLLKP